MRRVLVLGTFDMLHAGHVDHFRLASQLGDRLYVGVAHDALVRAWKGPDRPIVLQPEREAMVRAIRYVDEVRVYGNHLSTKETNERDMQFLVMSVNPQVFAEGDDSYERGGVLAGWLESLGVERYVFPRLSLEDISTSAYIKKIRGSS